MSLSRWMFAGLLAFAFALSPLAVDDGAAWAKGKPDKAEKVKKVKKAKNAEGAAKEKAEKICSREDQNCNDANARRQGEKAGGKALNKAKGKAKKAE